MRTTGGVATGWEAWRARLAEKEHDKHGEAEDCFAAGASWQLV